MKESLSFEKVNDTEVVTNNKKHANVNNFSDPSLSRRRFGTDGTVYEDYLITIRQKPCRSSSLSDLTAKSSDLIGICIPYTDSDDTLWRLLIRMERSINVPALNLFHDTSQAFSGGGDFARRSVKQQDKNPPMSHWSNKGKKAKKLSTMNPEYPTKFVDEFIHNPQRDHLVFESSSCVENSSVSSTGQVSTQRGATFPFESTPSGNLKVQSNQVVFQSSTVGVLLADPTQAKVKVKFEGKAAGEPNDDGDNVSDTGTLLEPQLQYGPRDAQIQNFQPAKTTVNDRNVKAKSTNVREDKGKTLNSLGYAIAEPIDWMRVQLPKKMDLFQEFYRRLHNYINTDTLVHIGDEVFHCHHVVLQIYSTFFDMNHHREIELPVTNVTPEAFATIYEWMIFSGQESNKVLRKDNILDLFCAAQYLSIKDLEDQCWSFVVNESLFMEDTAFALFREARKKGMTPVMDLMVPRVMRFFLPLIASKDFLELEPEEVMTFLKSNYICVTSEMEVLMAGVRWLHGDWAARRPLAIEVMRCIRFGLISPWQLVDIKRNPDNNEILEIVNETEVQQMVDDGLAYVIIKYWYGNSSQNYYHWIDVLGLTEPAERNWIGEEKHHVTYKDFLKYLEQFMVPKDQMYQQMAMMQPVRRNEDLPGGSLRGMDNDKMDMRRPKFDFPLPATLKGLAGDKDKSFPTMSEFFESRRKTADGNQSQSTSRPPLPPMMEMPMQKTMVDKRAGDLERQYQRQQEEQRKIIQEHQNQQSLSMRRKPVHPIHLCSLQRHSAVSLTKRGQMYEPPEKDSAEEVTISETSSVTMDSRLTSMTNQSRYTGHGEKRHSVAATYLAAATAALAGPRIIDGPPTPTPRNQNLTAGSRPEPTPRSGVTGHGNYLSPDLSMFNQSKESLARANMNKLSTSILGPSNKNYIAEGSLFDWDRETVLVFGGIDPHTAYGVGRNTGKDIYKFDPVTNIWDYVGDLPEPRHHHSVAFLRGRVYLVGGADPRDDDIRGKSMVVSTVWSYEPVTRSWYSESGLAIPRKNFGLVVHRMALYAIGGQDKKGRVLRSVERFDPKTGSWSEVRSMGVARMAVAAAKYREYIWVAGGMTGEKKKPVCRVVECYNSKTNEWTEIHTLRFPRCFATLFSMNDKLYLVGGAGRISDKEKTASSVAAIDTWDWKEREWRQLTDMSIPRHGHALAYLGTQLIIIGGVTTIYMRALNNVESFCCERGAWIRGVAALPSPLSGHGAVTLPPASLM